MRQKWQCPWLRQDWHGVLHVFAFSRLPLLINNNAPHQIRLLYHYWNRKTLKVKESQLPMKMDQTCTILSCPAIFTNNFWILQIDQTYQVLEPLQGINGAASPPFIHCWLASPLLSSPLRRDYYSVGKPTTDHHGRNSFRLLLTTLGKQAPTIGDHHCKIPKIHLNYF
jgi:hypothetical protein